MPSDGLFYRNQDYCELCRICSSKAPFDCVRCGHFFCESHKPLEDYRCQTCENDWLKLTWRRETGAWRAPSQTILNISKWSFFISAIGFSAALLAAILGAPYSIIWIGLLSLLGLPISAISLLALPATRTVERVLDKNLTHDRERFLSERPKHLLVEAENK